MDGGSSAAVFRMQIAKRTSSSQFTSSTRLIRPAMAAIDEPALSVNADGFVAFSIRSAGTLCTIGLPRFLFPADGVEGVAVI
jgi:hypothetical protein